MSARTILPCLVLLAVAAPAFAGGPLLIWDSATRTPYSYFADTVDVYLDLGANGILTNEQSDFLMSHGLDQWNSVATSSFAAKVSGNILVGGVPTDIVLANADSVVGNYNGGGVSVVYDTDGSVLSGLFGAPPGALGVASPEWVDDLTGEIVESFVILSGAGVDPGDTSPYPGASYAGVYTHEFGHSINLAHTQTNGANYFFGDPIGPGGCSELAVPSDYSDIVTMYPFIDPSPAGTGIDQSTVEHLDDTAPLSDLYPAPGWPAGFVTITGHVVSSDSTTEITGVNVIARNLADPLGDAQSALSGDYTQGELGPDGLFTLTGLTPGAQYVLYIDTIVQGGFSTTPFAAYFPEEYWNGAGESGDAATDTVCSYVPLSGGPGAVLQADIYLNVNSNALGLGDDDAVQVDLPFPFSFCGTTYNSTWVSSNGSITFGLGDTSPAASPAGLLVGAPRIAGFWCDLDPTSGGSITTSEIDGNFVVSWNSVPEYPVLGYILPNTFSITLRPDGTYQVSYGTLEALFTAMLAGRSPGGGASDPGPTDLSLAPKPLGDGVETVYETYDFISLDLSGLTLEYAPCGFQVGVFDPDIRPTAPALLQSRPNPFRSSTTIAFELPREEPVRLQVFDVNGRLVSTLVDERMEAGRHTVDWRGEAADGRDAPPGMYFYRITTEGFTTARKILRLR